MSEFGEVFRKAREAQGLSLQQAEEATRIRRIFLSALEEERFSDLPGVVYARGFIRSYARFLGLDAESLIVTYNREMGESIPKAPQVLDEPLVRHARPSIWSRLFLVVMILIILGLGGWYAYNRFYLGIDPLPVRPAPTAVPVAAPTQPDPTPTAIVMLPTPTGAAQEPAGQAVPSATPTQEPTQNIRVSPTAVVNPARTVTPTPLPTAAPVQVEGVRVEARLLAATYLEVSADGAQTYAGTLNQGDSRVWEAKERLDMLIGNAGGIRLTVNGVELEPLGADGQVLTVSYTPETLP